MSRDLPYYKKIEGQVYEYIASAMSKHINDAENSHEDFMRQKHVEKILEEIQEVQIVNLNGKLIVSIPSGKVVGQEFSNGTCILRTPNYELLLENVSNPFYDNSSDNKGGPGRKVIELKSTSETVSPIRVVNNETGEVVKEFVLGKNEQHSSKTSPEKELPNKSWRELFGIEWEAFTLDPRCYEIQSVKRADGSSYYTILPPPAGSEAERKWNIIKRRSPEDIERYIKYFAFWHEKKQAFNRLVLGSDDPANTLLEMNLDFGDIVYVRRNAGSELKGLIVSAERKGQDIYIGIKSFDSGEVKYVINPKKEDFMPNKEQ